MTEPTVIRAEATVALADLTDNLGLVTFQTAEGRIAIQMTRQVFADLFREMQHALAQGNAASQVR